MWRPGQSSRFGRRAECADAHKTLGVGGPKSGVNASGQFIEDAEQVGDK
jgi:hypothetical protein